MLIVLLTLVLVLLVVAFVGAPLRAGRSARAGQALGVGGGLPVPAHAGQGGGAQVLEQERTRQALEAAREAKYREIRDTELDYRTGKLSEDDYRAIDSQLRAEALEILDRLEPPTSEQPEQAPERPTPRDA